MSDADVLTALQGLAPAAAPEWTPRQAGDDPLREAFDAHADGIFRYVAALTGRDAWLAEELVTQVFVGATEDADRTAAALFMQARHAALAILAKAGDDAPGPVAPAELALVLERRAGLELDELARTWGARPAALEARLIEAAEQHTTGDEACTDWKEATVRASVDLLSEEQGEAWAEHLMECEACAAWSEALEERLASREGLPATERTWERVQAELSKHTRDLGIRVGVRCTYCHAGLPQKEAAFCAACLAPHHSDCFSEHGACAAPACGGTQLVYPQRPAAPRRQRWPWVMAGVLVSGAAFAGFSDTVRERWERSAGVATVVDAPPTRGAPIPLDVIQPGAKRADVELALGVPEAVIERDGETVLAYYSKGARALLNERGHVIQASFFGQQTSDAASGPIDYVPHLWTYRRQILGNRATPALLSAASQNLTDANGNRALEFPGNVIAFLDGDMRVLSVHLAPFTHDSNGNLSWGTFELNSDGSLRGEAPPIPLGALKPGSGRDAVFAALGDPDAVRELDNGRQRASWYAKGARVVFDGEGRLIQASFFGQRTSDGLLDANGNRKIGGESGLYQAGDFSYRGVVLGDPVAPSFVLNAKEDSTPDASGDQFLVMEDGVIAHLQASSLRLLAVHVATLSSMDANGNVEPGVYDLTQVLHGREIVGELLQEARDLGTVTRLLGTTHYRVNVGLQEELDNELYRLEVKLAPGDLGLELVLDIWTKAQAGWAWQRLSERVGWDGSFAGSERLVYNSDYAPGLRYSQVAMLAPNQVASAEQTLDLVEIGEVRRLVAFDRTRRRSAQLDEGEDRRHTSRLFCSFLLPQLLKVEQRSRLVLLGPFPYTSQDVFELPVEEVVDREGRLVRESAYARLAGSGRRELLALTPKAPFWPATSSGTLEVGAISADAWAELAKGIEVPLDPTFYWPQRRGPTPMSLVAEAQRGHTMLGRAFARGALQTARESGVLEQVLGVTYLVSTDHQEYATFEVSLAEDGSGLVMSMDVWSNSGGMRPWAWRRAEERLSWSGEVLGYQDWRAHNGIHLTRTQVKRSGRSFKGVVSDYDFSALNAGKPGRVKLRETSEHFGEAREDYDPEADTSGLFASLVLPRLVDSVLARVKLNTLTGQNNTVDLAGWRVIEANGNPVRFAARHMTTEPGLGGAIRALTFDPKRRLPVFLNSESYVAMDAKRWSTLTKLNVKAQLGRGSYAFRLPTASRPTPMELIEAENALELVKVQARHEAPTEAAATLIYADKVELAWVPHPLNKHVVVTYSVYRQELGVQGTWERIAVDLKTTRYTDTGVTPDTSYAYKVVSVATIDLQDPTVELAAKRVVLPESERRKEIDLMTVETLPEK